MPKKLTGIRTRDRRGIVDESRNQSDHDADDDDLADLRVAHHGKQALAQHVNQSGALDSAGQDEHAQHGDRGRARQPGETFRDVGKGRL